MRSAWNIKIKWINYSKIRANAETSVISQVNEAHRALVEENKAYMTIVIDILIYTATQNICSKRKPRKSGELQSW
jgi:hypothetical protein